MSFLNTRNRRRSAVVAVVAVAAIGGGAAAFAYWTADGTGSGTAITGASNGFTITSTAPVGPLLSPGSGDVQTVTFRVTNTNTGTESLSNVSASVANADGSTWVSTPAGCTAADYTVSAPQITYGNIPGTNAVLPAVNYVEGTVTITMNETGLNQDVCQNQTVPLYFTTVVPD